MNKVLFIILAVACSLYARAEVVDKVLAIVSEEPILQSDLVKLRQQLRSDKIQDELFTINKNELLKDDKKAMEFLIEERILKSEIKRQNLEVTKEAVDDEINKIQRRNKISRAQLREALKAQGTNFADYLDYIKERMERQAVIQQSITSKIRISEEDINAHYLEKYGKSKKHAFQYTLSHILFRKGDAAKNAQETYNKIKEGKNFEELAAQNSEDPNFTSGGSLGKFKSGEVMKEIENAVANLEPGDITPPVKTQMGVHIIKVNEKKLIPSPDYEAKKSQIQAELTNKALKEQFRFWIEQKKKETFIKINS
ncbi:MAG: peptidylprolyl isomerase [Bdellovibrionales bacterium]|nr:peptidylprolyl isomerase [Bdellovibrionales bacterium]